MDPYKTFPVVENDKYLLRAVTNDDVTELLSVYSDEKGVPYFNGDNCHGDNFHYTTKERMMQAIDFWIMSYDNGWFVRWAIVDKATKSAIGTIEYFKRASDTTFNDYGVLRLDLGSDFERSDVIKGVVEAFLSVAFEPFGVRSLITKIWSYAEQRRAAFTDLGFKPAADKLIGNDGTEYGDYYFLDV